MPQIPTEGIEQVHNADREEPTREILAADGFEAVVQPNIFFLTGEPCIIGRHAQCNIVIHHRDISRLHATITFARPYYYLTDENSTNGTFVNGERIRGAHILRAGDMIGLGEKIAQLKFHDPDQTTRHTGGIRYDSLIRQFYVGEVELTLTPGQHKLLLHLYEHAGSLCTYESCAVAIWGREYTPGLDATALEQTVHGLRGSLTLVFKDPVLVRDQVLVTRKKQGYLLKPEHVDNTNS